MPIILDLTPKVSIIIPVFNGAKYLSHAIDSALAQTYQNIEVIVVNDGSNDNGQTDKVAQSYGERIRYFRKKNGGVATALNLGIHQMTGKYFSWLSHDDLYYPDKIESQIDFFKKVENKDLVLFCDSESIDEHGTFRQSLTIKKEHINNVMLLILSTSLHGCSLLIPKAAFYKVGLFNEALRNTQDVEMWLRLAMAGYKFQHVPKVMVKGRMHRHQTTRTSARRHAREVTNYFQWSLDVIDLKILLDNKRDILKILFNKNQPKAICHFINILRNNRGLTGLHSVLAIGFLTLLKKYINGKLNTIPTYISIRNAIKQRLLRFPSAHK